MRLATGLGLVLAGALALGMGGCGKKKKKAATGDSAMKPDMDKPDKTVCPDRFRDLMARDKLEPGQATECKCKKDASKSPVWGNMIFTTDSSICGAAVYAGALAADAKGKVKMMTAKGCEVYKGGKKNGVTSSKWGSFSTSFYFPGFGKGECAKPKPKEPALAKLGKCPASFSAVKEASDKGKYECTCDKKALKKKASVWGNGIYTADSSICQAAKHSGAIKKGGKTVLVHGAAGCNKYKGKKRNGVKSKKWGKFRLSFFFPGHGKAECKK